MPHSDGKAYLEVGVLMIAALLLFGGVLTEHVCDRRKK